MQKGLPSIADREAIAEELETAKRQRETVNSVPEVKAAREASDKARREADALHREFSRVFDKHYGKEDAVIGDLVAKYPRLLTLGGTSDYAHQRWVVRCAITGLPVFEGDRVYISGGDQDYEKVYILADYVTLNGIAGQREAVVA